MLKVGLVGIGFMGRGHLDQYIRLEKEGADIKLVAICDVDPNKFKGIFTPGNMGSLGSNTYDFSKYHLYTDFDEMIANEELDYVDMPLPTFLHCHYAVRAMEKGLNVLCEKPMALNPEQCNQMIQTAERTGKKLMIAQCLRFWPAYRIAKAYVDNGEFGKPVFGRFYRGGSTPAWSYQDWLRDESRSGGVLLDQHVHDVDTINYFFGMPDAVSTISHNYHLGAGTDAVSTHYRYENMVITAEDDWSQNGDGVNFKMTFLLNFERGSVEYDGVKTTVHPVGGKMFVADDGTTDDGYYNEIKYYTNCLENNLPIETAPLESTRDTIVIATAERESAAKNGEWISLK